MAIKDIYLFCRQMTFRFLNQEPSVITEDKQQSFRGLLDLNKGYKAVAELAGVQPVSCTGAAVVQGPIAPCIHSATTAVTARVPQARSFHFAWTCGRH